MTKAFGPESTTDEVLEGVDLSGKRVLVTGVSAGLGVETLRTLAAHSASVVGTARDLAKARRALAGVFPKAAKGAAIDLIELDLASLKSVRKAANELLAQARPFDVIIANAGVMACPEGKTEDGFETQFGINHLEAPVRPVRHQRHTRHPTQPRQERFQCPLQSLATRSFAPRALSTGGGESGRKTARVSTLLER